MTPKFSSAVDSVFKHVLALLDRISCGEEPSPSDERQSIRRILDQAEDALGHSEPWQLAKYALVAWIDEVLVVDAPWKGQQWWKENVLEFEYFKTHDRHHLFYAKARAATALPQKDALETFYLCVVLGFRGLYRDPAAAPVLAEPLGLEPDLEAWAKRTAAAIQHGQGRPPMSETNKALQGAAALEGPSMLVWASFFGLALAVFLLIVVWLFFIPTAPAVRP